MRHITALLILIFSTSIFAQNNVVKTAGVTYTAGAPTFTPGRTGSQVAIDTVTGFWYEHNGTSWSASGYRVQTISGCSAPAYTPAKYQSRLVINACSAGQGGPELYYYTGSAWLQINEGQTYTAGTGIDITAGVISNTAPGHTLKGGGSSMTARTGANFVSTSTVSAALTDDGAGDETEIRMSIPTDAITAVEIAADAVGSSEIAADAVGSSEIATDAVGSAEIAANAVGTSELASTAVTAGTYTNATVTFDADGRATSASSGTAPVTGTGADKRIAVWNGPNSVAAHDNLQYNSATSILSLQGRILLNNTSASISTPDFTFGGDAANDPVFYHPNSYTLRLGRTNIDWLEVDMNAGFMRGKEGFFLKSRCTPGLTQKVWAGEDGFGGENSASIQYELPSTGNYNGYLKFQSGRGSGGSNAGLYGLVISSQFDDGQISEGTQSYPSRMNGAMVNVTTANITAKRTLAALYVGLGDATANTNRSLYTENGAALAINAGNVGIGTASATQKLDVNGNTRLRSALYDGTNSAGSSGNILSSTGSATQWKNSASVLSGSTYVPTGTADALGTTGDFSYDSNYIYVKTPAGWKRATLSTF